MTNQRYQTDPTDAEWELLAPLLPPPKPGVRPRKINLREVVNALRYQLRIGCRCSI